MHAATLADGRQVVVKVLRPDIEKQIDADIALLKSAAALVERTHPRADKIRPREVVATLDGKNITAEEFQQLIVAMDPKAREVARNSAPEMLRYVGWLRRMGAEAEKRGLPAQSPLQLQLEMARIQLLSNAVIQQHEIEEVVTPFEQRGYYQANMAAYSLPITPPPSTNRLRGR